jgi:hypothetical protein
MLEADALVDWHRLRARLREDLGTSRDRRRLSPWLRMAAWALFAGGWSLVGFPLVAILAVVIFEALVVPGLSEPPRHMDRTVEWLPSPSFVISPEAPPPRGASR